MNPKGDYMKNQICLLLMFVTSTAFAQFVRPVNLNIEAPSSINIAPRNCRLADDVRVRNHKGDSMVVILEEIDSNSFSPVAKFIVSGAVRSARLEYRGGWGWDKKSFDPCILVVE